MWPSFWIAVAIGLVQAIPILKGIKSEGFWMFLGLAVNGIQSGTFHTVVKPRDNYRTQEVCELEGPWGIPSTNPREPVCREVPVYAGPATPEIDFGEFFSGLLIDYAAEITAGLLEIGIVLMFLGKEKSAVKRREIFGFGGKGEQ